jgi:hypothetical protein
MKVTDYNSKLAQAKQKFNDDGEELRTNYKRNLKNLNETHEFKEKNQYENYQNQRLKTEEGTARMVDEMGEKTRADLSAKTERFANSLAKEKVQGELENKKNMNEYSRRLGLIRESFDSNSKETKEHYDQVRDQTDIKYSKDIKNRAVDYNNSIKELTDKTSDQVSELRLNQDREKKGIGLRHKEETNKLISYNNKVKNLSSNLYQQNLERVKKTADDQLKFQKENANLRIDNLRGAVNKERDNQAVTHEDRMHVLEQKNKLDIKAINNGYTESVSDSNRRIADIRQGHQKQIHALMDAEKLVSDEDILKKKHETQMRHFRNTLNENNAVNNKLNKRLVTDQKDERKSIIENNNKEKVDLIKEKQKEKNEMLGDARKNFDNYREQSLTTQKTLKTRLDDSVMNARKDKIRVVGTQQLKYENEIKKLNEANAETMSAIKEDMAQEQSKYFQAAKRNKYNEIKDLKEGMSYEFAKKEASYEKRLMAKDQELKALELASENKLSIIKEKLQEENRRTVESTLDRQTEDRLSVQRQMKLQHIDFDKKMSAIRNDFDKKMMSVKGNHDVLTTKLTSRYEDIIKRDRTEFSKEQTRRQAMMNGELQKINRRNEMERDSLIKQYEVKLAKLKEANRVANQKRNIRASSELS